MKRIVIILLITILTAFGCTRIPSSVETGVKPGEYQGSINSNELKKENESLTTDLENTKKQLEKSEEDYLSLAKNNDLILKKLDSAESLLNVLQNDELPKFKVEETDKGNIYNYLSEKKSVLDDVNKSIEIIPLQSNENIVLYETIGYGESYKQLFVWEIGKNEPVMIDGANCDKDGSWKWLLQDKYIIINSAKLPKKLIVDIEGKKVISTLDINSDNIYLVPSTASILFEKAKPDSSAFALYDFVIGEEKELTFDFKNKNLKFEVDEANKAINFSGTYSDENETEYTIQAVMSIEKLKEKYAIKTIEQSILQKNSTDGQGKIEKNGQGTV